jgi:hypothetical protein
MSWLAFIPAYSAVLAAIIWFNWIFGMMAGAQ